MERNAEQKKDDLKPKFGLPCVAVVATDAAVEDTAAGLNYERRELTEGKKGITKECNLSAFRRQGSFRINVHEVGGRHKG